MRSAFKLNPVPLILCLALGIPGIAMAQENDAKVKKDLKTVLALQGKTCNEITGLENLGENDYLVTCKDGNRYRIRVNEDDRVVIEEQ